MENSNLFKNYICEAIRGGVRDKLAIIFIMILEN